MDPRIKLVLLLVFAVSIALPGTLSLKQLGAYLISLTTIALLARLPVLRIFRLSLLVVPFAGLFSLAVYLSGDGRRAWLILAKSYLSALSVLVCMSSTPLPDLLRAARSFRIPGFLLEVTQLIYRYLFVLGGQARVMQTAFSSRAGRPGRRAIRASSGMVAVLFSRSYEKAIMVHQAMCSRGFSVALPQDNFAPLQWPEIGILAAGLLLTIAIHFL